MLKKIFHDIFDGSKKLSRSLEYLVQTRSGAAFDCSATPRNWNTRAEESGFYFSRYIGREITSRLGFDSHGPADFNELR